MTPLEAMASSHNPFPVNPTGFLVGSYIAVSPRLGFRSQKCRVQSPSPESKSRVQVQSPKFSEDVSARCPESTRSRQRFVRQRPSGLTPRLSLDLQTRPILSPPDQPLRRPPHAAASILPQPPAFPRYTRETDPARPVNRHSLHSPGSDHFRGGRMVFRRRSRASRTMGRVLVGTERPGWFGEAPFGERNDTRCRQGVEMVLGCHLDITGSWLAV